jgi:hypothetical protein
MENKYFTPDIEDICIGYELEMNWNRAYEEKWVPVKISIQDEEFVYTDEISDIINALDDGMSEARVPYLTKEQIEAEGWKLDSSPDSNEMHFIKKIKKSRHYLEFYPNTKEVIINKINTESLPFKCKDINTFRKIIKLLEI